MTPGDLDAGVVQARLRLIEYVEIDLETVAKATHEAKSHYRAYVRSVSAWLLQREGA